MSSIKLKPDTGGGSFEIKAPSNSNNTRVLTLPDTGDLTLGGPYGKILQVKQFAKSDAVSAQPGTSFADISGFTTTITPSSSTSKILVMVMINAAGNDTTALRLLRGSSSILQGDTVTNKISVAAGIYSGNSSTGTNYYGGEMNTLVKLDEPGVDTELTYKMQWRASNGSNTLYLNRNTSDVSQYAFRTVSTITLMEVGA